MGAFFEIDREMDRKISILKKSSDVCEPHFHSNIELMYVIDGKIDVNINGRSKTLTRGCISIANSYDIHTYTNSENSRNCVMIIPVELVSGYNAMLHSKVFSTPFISECDQTHRIYYVIEHEINPEGPGCELINTGCAHYILGLVLNCVELVEKPSPSSTDLARKILVYIQQNYLEVLSIEKLAKHFGYNKDYLSKFFNSFLGCGFNNYLNALRSRHAATLISEGQTDLTGVAFTSGFDNYRTFNRAFKQSYAMTPSEYRKNATEII
jgi:AraC-like DNA-binding protein